MGPQLMHASVTRRRCTSSPRHAGHQGVGAGGRRRSHSRDDPTGARAPGRAPGPICPCLSCGRAGLPCLLPISGHLVLSLWLGRGTLGLAGSSQPQVCSAECLSLHLLSDPDRTSGT